MVIRKEDLADLDIIDSFELASDGYAIFLSTTLISTNNIGNIITINYPSDGEGLITGRDHLVQSGDKVRLAGTSGGLADGYHIVNAIIDETSFSVLSSIATSTGGTIDFMYQAGAKSVGFDLKNYIPIHISHTNVQKALEDLDLAITAAGGYTAKEVEVDFGTIPTNYKTFTITDAMINTGSLLFPTQSGKAPTGRHEDENEMDPIIFSAAPKTGNFILRATTIDGPVVGKYKVNYGIG